MEADELKERAEEARAPFDKRVAATMAGIAAALAIVSVFGQILANEELLEQQKASDQWAYFQAKSSRRYESEIASDIAKYQTGEAAAKAVEKYAANMEKYQKESEEIQAEARKLQTESEEKGRKAHRMHFGEVFLEIGIVFASLAILTKRHLVWIVSMLLAAAGIGIALTSLGVS